MKTVAVLMVLMSLQIVGCSREEDWTLTDRPREQQCVVVNWGDRTIEPSLHCIIGAMRMCGNTFDGVPGPYCTYQIAELPKFPVPKELGAKGEK